MGDALLNWGTQFILAVQSISSPFLDAVFTGFTLLGEEEFFLLFLPLIYWCINKRIGIRLAVVLLLGDYLNGLLKLQFATPRPDDPRIRVLRAETTYGFPSAHAQNSATVWGYLSTQVRNRIFWAVAVLLVLLNGFSRIYLGVHYPHDVIGGWVIGALVVLLFNIAATVVDNLIVPGFAKLVGAVLVPVALLSLTFTDFAARDMGTLLGLGLGALLERTWVDFDPRADAVRQVARLAIGLAVAFGLWMGSRNVLPPGEMARFARYALLGFWVAGLAPWLFVATGLAKKEGNRRQRTGSG